MGRVIQVNPDAFGDGEFEPIPTGTKIKVAVFDIEEGVTGPNSQKPGTPQFVFTAKVTEDGPYKGREIRYNYITLDPNAKGAWALVAFAEAVGWRTSKDKGVELPDDLRDVLGTEFVARIGQVNSQKVNPTTGQPYVNNRVTGYQKLKASDSKPKEQVGWDEL